MKIDKIEAGNFGCFKYIEYIPGKFQTWFGKNGSGKTTLMNIIRFALTGAEPEGDIIRKDADEMHVTLYLTDAEGQQHTFTREKFREKASKFRVDKKITTAASLNKKIEEIVGIPLDKIKIVSSADIISAMKPQEFGSFIMGYIPKKVSLAEVIKFTTPTPGMIEIMEANLPEDGIDVDVIDEFADFCKANRKELKAQIAAKKLILSEKPAEDPEIDADALNNRLKELGEIDSKLATYSTLKSAYDRAVADKERYTSKIAELRAQASTMSTTKPDPAVLENIKEEEESERESLRRQEIAKTSASTALVQLRKTLEALEKPICPISPLITCHENKTVAKEEVAESVSATEEGLAAIEAEISKIKESLEKIAEKKAEAERQERAYETRLGLLRQIAEMEKMIPDVPAEPEKPEVEDIEAEKFQINEKLKVLDSYLEGRRLAIQIESLSLQEDDYDRLVKSTSEKGEIRVGVVSAFLSLFEDTVNERSKKHDPSKVFKFKAESGVTVYMNGLKFSELSGGERAYMIFALVDLLNVLSGTKLLLLDELSVLDADTFRSLCGYIKEYSEEYDHILLSGVNHPDIISIADSLGFENISIKDAC